MSEETKNNEQTKDIPDVDLENFVKALDKAEKSYLLATFTEESFDTTFNVNNRQMNQSDICPTHEPLFHVTGQGSVPNRKISNAELRSR
jgi:hypothetical protein